MVPAHGPADAGRIPRRSSQYPRPSTVSRSTDLQEVLQDALERILTAIKIESGGVYLLQEESQTLTLAACAGISPDLVRAIDNLAVGEGFFLARQRLAVVGVSRDPKDFTRRLFDELSQRGYDLVPVNPHAQDIAGRPCYGRLQDIPAPVDGALIMTHQGMFAAPP